MDNKKIQIEVEPTQEQLNIINQVNDLLGTVELELIGTRPKDR